ncbi:MAG TPA: NADP-dependent oxidoreductase [Anaerolineales bacterium]|nr:NADP-dependent oxidoreductase [Anaerolineales bacterium]
MKAVRIHGYGGLDVLSYEEAPRPKPGADEVLIRVFASSVNPFDCAVRAGYLNSYFNYTLPLILGTDASGVIEEVGENVTEFKPGDEVYTRAGVWRDGSYAEYVAVAAADVAFKPKTVDHFHAAALPHVTLTAWQALVEIANVAPGQKVLIHAAAGGVGHIAVQLSKLRGATTIGTASVNLEALKELEVDETIDYSTTAFENEIKDVDVVLDLIGGDTQQRSWAVLRPGGILIGTVQPPSEETAQSHGVRQNFISTAPPIKAVLTEVANLVDTGQLKPIVSAILPLSEIQKGHEMVEGKHVHGKVVLSVSDF